MDLRARLGAASDGDSYAVMCVIDNLVKGAAGGALQWMNRLLGIDETAGLRLPGPAWLVSSAGMSWPCTVSQSLPPTSTRLPSTGSTAVTSSRRVGRQRRQLGRGAPLPGLGAPEPPPLVV